MLTLEEIFDIMGYVKIFSTLDLRARYHQLPIHEDDRPKTIFWGINSDWKDCLYQWRFLPFGLKNALAKFQRVMDRMLAGLDFARCYVDDIITFNDIVKKHQRHL